jgi:hypothetical protein
LSDVYSYRTAFAASAAVFTIAVILATQIPETRNVEEPQDLNLRPFEQLD